MTCPSCQQPNLVEEDFYWCTGTASPCKNGEECKKCQSKKRAAKKKEKEDYAKQFFVA